MSLEAGLAQGLRWILSVAGVVVAGILGLKVLMLVVEPRLTFMPIPDLPITPARFDLPYEDVEIPVEEGVRIHGWFIPADRPRGDPPGDAHPPTLLFFHGNAENIAPNVPLARLAREAGFSTFLVDYRGYGGSTGSPSERGIYRDGEAALRYLRSREDVDPGRIIVWGRSIGSCVAVRLAAVPAGQDAPPAGLILESPFTSVRELLREGGSWILYPLSFLATYRFDQAALAHRINVPTLVIHGSADEVVPYRLGRALYEMIPTRVEFLTIDGGGHNDLMARHADAVWSGVLRFVESLDFTAAAIGADPDRGGEERAGPITAADDQGG